MVIVGYDEDVGDFVYAAHTSNANSSTNEWVTSIL